MEVMGEFPVEFLDIIQCTTSFIYRNLKNIDIFLIRINIGYTAAFLRLGVNGSCR